MNIILDPGHGGHDNGASGQHLVEDDLALAVALSCEAALEGLDHFVALTRRSDVFVSLAERASKPTRMEDRLSLPANILFVSIHFNAHVSQARGIETYYYSAGLGLATAIQESLMDEFPEEKDRGVKKANFYVLRKTSCPAVLVECNFISNREMEQLLMNSAYLERFGTAIADGIHNGKY